MIRPVSHISAMSAYALADLAPPEGKTLISLSQNESLRPPSPHAIEAAAHAMHDAQLYPDPDWRALREGLSLLHDVPAQSILCGCGSMELIACIARVFADEENAVLAPAHAYPFFRTAALLARARFDTAREDDNQVSITSLFAEVRPDTRIVFVANPGNPTGSCIANSELRRLREDLPDNVLLVIDEAYGEFSDHLDTPLFDLVDRGDTVILRSFSKAYGLAGMRVGWGVFPPVVAVEMRKVMNPNNVTVASQAAALAALTDQQFMRDTCKITAEVRHRFSKRLLEAGFDVPESHTNFVLLRLRDADQARRADEVLRREGVFLRPQGGVGLAHCLRATMGPADSMDIAAGLLEDWWEEETE